MIARTVFIVALLAFAAFGIVEARHTRQQHVSGTPPLKAGTCSVTCPDGSSASNSCPDGETCSCNCSSWGAECEGCMFTKSKKTSPKSAPPLKAGTCSVTCPDGSSASNSCPDGETCSCNCSAFGAECDGCMFKETKDDKAEKSKTPAPPLKAGTCSVTCPDGSSASNSCPDGETCSCNCSAFGAECDGCMFKDDKKEESNDALFARIRSELEARNYSRPTKGMGMLGSGVFGVDVSSGVSTDTWKCIKSKGFDFAIIRGFQETCNVDPNSHATVQAAWAGGMAHVDLYLFPSYGCGKSAAEQMDETINNMGSTPFGTIWLDIESGGQGSASSNHQWMMDALAEGGKRIGASRLGIYSSQYEWGQVMGSLSGPTSYPVWYADYDGQPSFNGFLRFGGWTNPAMKQWSGNNNICGASVDQNWYP
jgi:hypothetical protein